MRAPYTAELDASDIEKGTYPHYMLKEIDEQPAVIRKIIQAYQNEEGKLAIDYNITEAVSEADRIYIIACGTSYHAGLIGKQFIEKMAEIPVEVHVASNSLTICRYYQKNHYSSSFHKVVKLLIAVPY